MGYFSFSGTHLNQGFIQNFELGREQDGNRMIVVRESTLTHVYECVPT